MARYKIAKPLETFREGDEPAELVVELATLDGTPVSLEGITGASAELVAPDIGGYAGLPVEIVADELRIDVSAVVLAAPGVWELELVVVGASSSLAVEPAPLVVEAKRDGWHTLASSRAQWADAPRLDLALYGFLEGAKAQCLEYAPAVAPASVTKTRPASFTVPISQAGFVGSALISSPADRVAVIELELTNTTAVGAVPPRIPLTNDPAWKLNDGEYHIDAAYVISISGFPTDEAMSYIDVDIFNALLPGATLAERLVVGLEADSGTVVTVPPAVPVSWRQAQLMQARNCWNAAKTDPATGGIGGEEFVFRPYPMDQTIRYLLRPKRAVGAIA